MAHADLSDEQLVHKVLQTERDLVATRFKHRTNTLENSSRLRVLRREIARLRTEARRREIAAGLRKDELLAKHGRSFNAVVGASPATPDKGGFLSGIVDKLTAQE